MNKDQMAKQAQILRRKRHARKINASPQVKRGVVRLESPLPLPKQPKEASTVHINQSEIRRLRAEKILEQKKKMIAQQREKSRVGCGRCKRKK